jgi:hypothetical protein
MSNAEHPLFIEAGWFISYMNYYATGEGVTSWVAVSGDALSAEALLKERLDKFYHPLILTSPICIDMDADATRAMGAISDSVKSVLEKLPLGTGHFCTELHFNLA